LAHSCRQSEVKPNIISCELYGRVDAASAPQLKQELHDLFIQNKPRLVVSVRNLELMSAACVGVLVDFHQQALAKKGGVRMVGVNPKVQRVLDLVELSDVWGSYASEEEAIKSFKDGR
jgi:anti-sigma B factor antagonist